MTIQIASTAAPSGTHTRGRLLWLVCGTALTVALTAGFAVWATGGHTGETRTGSATSGGTQVGRQSDRHTAAARPLGRDGKDEILTIYLAGSDAQAAVMHSHLAEADGIRALSGEAPRNAEVVIIGSAEHEELVQRALAELDPIRHSLRLPPVTVVDLRTLRGGDQTRAGDAVAAP